MSRITQVIQFGRTPQHVRQSKHELLGVAFERSRKRAASGPLRRRRRSVRADARRDAAGEVSHSEGACVTHAQVSVNPANMLIGYHTDWAEIFRSGAGLERQL